MALLLGFAAMAGCGKEVTSSQKGIDYVFDFLFSRSKEYLLVLAFAHSRRGAELPMLEAVAKSLRAGS
jgi:hypothetical protein